MPTIVALLSNSITEVAAIADESMPLAVALSLSSVTAFFSRFGDISVRASESYFNKEHDENRKDERLPVAVEDLGRRIEKIKRETQGRGPKDWRRLRRWLCNAAICMLLLALSAGIWYEVYQITRYGIIVNACPVKVNVALWVGLSQLLTLLNVACRRFAFDIRTVQFKPQSTQNNVRASAPTPTPRGRPPLPANSPSAYSRKQKRGERRFKLVLRSPRNTPLRWTMQTFTAISSFTLYAFGTVVLASMTLIPASDAIRTLVVLTIGAGVGRLTGYWVASLSRNGRGVVVIDIPDGYIDDLHAVVEQMAKGVV